MDEFVKVLKVDELPSGSMKTVIVGGKKVALANVGGEYFAVDDTCTHEHCSLGGEGFLDVNVITCGCHGAQFDVLTGKVLSPPASTDLRRYEVKVQGTDICVKL